MAERAEIGKIAAVAVLVAGGVVAACGSSDNGPGGFGPSGDPGTTSDGGNGSDDGGGGNGLGSGGFGGGGFNTGDGGVSERDGGFAACATDAERGKPIPLTMAMMLDSSGSMWLRTAAGEIKWEALKAALNAFFTDTKSAGISVGVQYLPLFSNAAPNTCSSSAQCGATGPCVLKACSDAAGNYCDTDADCTAPAKCSVVLGQCHDEGEFKCRTAADCKFPEGDYGACDPIKASYCFREQESCNIPDYTVPVAPIAALPGAAGAVLASLNAHFPNGQTPTSAALQGIENMATDYLGAHQGEAVVSLLVTDGLPNLCDSNMNDVAAIAAKALTAGIKTYVVGVFAPSEQAQSKPNLDQIAKAGGTNQAFIVNTGGSATAQFVQTLNAIRTNSLPCEFTLPVPKSGTPDYAKVNVQFTTSAGKQSLIIPVQNATKCDAAAGGWHYDVDLKANVRASPTKVQLCPATCNVMKADTGSNIDILQGCKDVVTR